jgi:hypothetical protein
MHYYILSSTITITYVNILISWFYSVCKLYDFCNVSKVEVKTPWRRCRCVETCSSTYNIQNIFKVCESVHHHTIQINQPTRCNNLSSLLLDIYLQLNMFRTSSRPSSGAQQLQKQPLVLPSERGGSSAVVRSRAERPVGPTTTNSTATIMLQR